MKQNSTIFTGEKTKPKPNPMEKLKQVFIPLGKKKNTFKIFQTPNPTSKH